MELFLLGAMSMDAPFPMPFYLSEFPSFSPFNLICGPFAFIMKFHLSQHTNMYKLSNSIDQQQTTFEERAVSNI